MRPLYQPSLPLCNHCYVIRRIKDGSIRFNRIDDCFFIYGNNKGNRWFGAKVFGNRDHEFLFLFMAMWNLVCLLWEIDLKISIVTEFIDCSLISYISTVYFILFLSFLCNSYIMWMMWIDLEPDNQTYRIDEWESFVVKWITIWNFR